MMILVIQVTLIHSSTAADEQAKTIVITTIDYPPLLGRTDGIMNDIVQEAFISVGIKVKFKIFPLARITWAVKNGSSNIVLGSKNWFYKSNLSTFKNYVSIYKSNFKFFGLKEKFPQGINYKMLSDLKSYKIGYIHAGSLIPLLPSLS
jgi:hypothetical protein